MPSTLPPPPDGGVPPVVVLEGVRRRFGQVDALAGLDLVVPSNQITVLLGPNGAGKTTAVGAEQDGDLVRRDHEVEPGEGVDLPEAAAYPLEGDDWGHPIVGRRRQSGGHCALHRPATSES